MTICHCPPAGVRPAGQHGGGGGGGVPGLLLALLARLLLGREERVQDLRQGVRQTIHSQDAPPHPQRRETVQVANLRLICLMTG